MSARFTPFTTTRPRGGQTIYPQIDCRYISGTDGIAHVSDPEADDSDVESSLSELESSDDRDNPLADFAFNKLPNELLVKIFKHARNNAQDANRGGFFYPVVLTHVCRLWRMAALGASTLWTDIQILDYDRNETKEAVRIYLERSGDSPIFLTWTSAPIQTIASAEDVVNDLIFPHAKRWRRITLTAKNEIAQRTLLLAMASLDFPVLQDFEISRYCVPSSLSNLTICRGAPVLRRCRLHEVYSFPPLPSNLVVLDLMFTPPRVEVGFDLDPLLEFLSHVVHSLKHLRLGPLSPLVLATPREPKISLDKLESLIIRGTHVILDHILTPNLTTLSSFYIFDGSPKGIAEKFNNFFAPSLRSIQFRRTPLLPLLISHDFPTMFPNLESILVSNCLGQSAFVSLLRPFQSKGVLSLEKESEHPPKYRDVENPFPKLKEFAISDTNDLASLQTAIEERSRNGDKSLRRIYLPREVVTETTMQHFVQWLPEQGIELALYEPRHPPDFAPPEFQDDFGDLGHNFFF